MAETTERGPVSIPPELMDGAWGYKPAPGERFVTSMGDGSEREPTLELYPEPSPTVVSPQLYASIEAEVTKYRRRKRDEQWCTHVGPVPMPNRAERRRAASLKRRRR